jgi:hypothetical protein
MSQQPDNIFAGTQVVSLVEVRGTNNSLGDVAFHKAECQRLCRELQSSQEASQSPELPSEETRTALNDLLIRIRLARPETVAR